MNWITAKDFLLKNVEIGNHIDLSSTYRYVLAKPKEGDDFYKISIGTTAYIKLSLEMLENIYNATLSNKGIYNRAIIYGLYPQAVNNHGCHVRVVGLLFVSAGIMVAQGSNFKII